MKYYKYPNPYITDDEIAIEYIEVTDSGIHMRQLSVFKDYYISSNVDLFLAEKPLLLEDVKNEENQIEPITKNEFSEIWQEYLNHHKSKWAKIKKAFPINKPVIGCIRVFFPQGIIVELGEQVFGVTGFKKAKATVNSEFIMSTRYQITGIITGYDENNQWIKLDSPQIYADKQCDLHAWQSPT